MPKIKHVELFMSSRSPSVILTLASLNLVCFIFSLFLFNFYWFFLVAIIKMLKIKDKFAKILKLFSSVEKVETPPICMQNKKHRDLSLQDSYSLCRLKFQLVDFISQQVSSYFWGFCVVPYNSRQNFSRNKFDGKKLIPPVRNHQIETY